MLYMLAQDAASSATQNDAALMWGFILFGASVVLVVLEMFVPSGGLLGLTAGACAVGSIVAFFVYDEKWGLASLGLYLVLGPVIGVWAFKLWLNSPVARMLILGGSVTSEDDPEAADNEQARRARQDQWQALIGAEGVTATALRPVGTVIIEGERIDALAESGIIEADVPVRVTDVYDNQIKVRPIE